MTESEAYDRALRWRKIGLRALTLRDLFGEGVIFALGPLGISVTDLK